ncbi:uncharacterized protein PV06_08334 [Exophiala oligosperma]|uniref:Uncharacterized protein n=1 Tax=Exophiala oligosperma TaxID=215243 RepID=A0A0D2D9E8_9EURO|nr:uncharacterized protein PV06_08334 [Exophiala oligosperma]KIW39748.1 hypothetical protein PV06_08334 [Exophiala oligosperma]
MIPTRASTPHRTVRIPELARALSVVPPLVDPFTVSLSSEVTGEVTPKGVTTKEMTTKSNMEAKVTSHHARPRHHRLGSTRAQSFSPAQALRWAQASSGAWTFSPLWTRLLEQPRSWVLRLGETLRGHSLGPGA